MQYSACGSGRAGQHCTAWKSWVIVELVAEGLVSYSGLLSDIVLSFGMLNSHVLGNVKEKAVPKTSFSTTGVHAYAQVSGTPLVNVGFGICSCA